jgi:hypothetical protein
MFAKAVTVLLTEVARYISTVEWKTADYTQTQLEKSPIQ